jgi:hypothetical protein
VGELSPNKSFFSWQALLGRLPIRDNLARRGIVFDGAEACCVCCGNTTERGNHLLVSCQMSWVVWSKVHRWFDFTTVLSDSIGALFRCFLMPIRPRKNASKAVLLVWHAIIWVLWKARNERIFRG